MGIILVLITGQISSLQYKKKERKKERKKEKKHFIHMKLATSGFLVNKKRSHNVEDLKDKC